MSSPMSSPVYTNNTTTVEDNIDYDAALQELQKLQELQEPQKLQELHKLQGMEQISEEEREEMANFIQGLSSKDAFFSLHPMV